MHAQVLYKRILMRVQFGDLADREISLRMVLQISQRPIDDVLYGDGTVSCVSETALVTRYITVPYLPTMLPPIFGEMRRNAPAKYHLNPQSSHV